MNFDDYTYDWETYPNICTCYIKHKATGVVWLFEMSDRRNDFAVMMQMFRFLASAKSNRMVGFNNIGFDYILIHNVMQNEGIYSTLSGMEICQAIYSLAQTLILGTKEQKLALTIWPNQRFITQLDLFKIHHFDNKARRTSLKALEFQMQSQDLRDLPFPPGTVLNDEQKDILISYNAHDVNETEKFLIESAKLVAFREELTETYGRDVLNDNDTKIGKDYFINQLEEMQPGICFERVNGKRKPRQTIRPYVALKDVILPWIKFEHPEFCRILDWLKTQVLTQQEIMDAENYGNINTKGVFEDASCTVNDFTFDFGLGGIHGSVSPCTAASTQDEVIIDLDVASYYPNLAIANRMYPEHLSEAFCDIYKDVFEQRRGYEKGSPENQMLKLALNGVYGDSNNQYSPFYDPQYTMSITINGQVLLCVLAEQLMKIPGLKMIQINTDGLTVKLNRGYVSALNDIWKWWEQITGLELESVEYEAMFIRDVNNYIGVSRSKKPGKVYDIKRKGKYEHAHPRDRKPLGWHQDTSQLVVPKIVEKILMYGGNVLEEVMAHEPKTDFLMREKVNRGSRLFIGETQVENTLRYIVSVNGGRLTKRMPPLKKQLDVDPNAQDRQFAIKKTWLVSDCNRLSDLDPAAINYRYYVAEVHKLIDPILKGGLI